MGGVPVVGYMEGRLGRLQTTECGKARDFNKHKHISIYNIQYYCCEKTNRQ